MSVLVCSLDVITSLQGGGKTMACPSGKGHGKNIYIGPMIRIAREIWCLPYAGFFKETLASTALTIPAPGTSRAASLSSPAHPGEAAADK